MPWPQRSVKPKRSVLKPSANIDNYFSILGHLHKIIVTLGESRNSEKGKIEGLVVLVTGGCNLQLWNLVDPGIAKSLPPSHTHFIIMGGANNSDPTAQERSV